VSITNTGGIGLYGTGSPGVLGAGYWFGSHGVVGRAGVFAAGVRGEGNALAYGGWFTSSNIVLNITSPAENTTAAILVDGGNDGEVDFKVTNAGAVYADGGYNTPASDFAELLSGAPGLEPGDVLAVGPDGTLVRATEAYQTSVVGVYSTKPGFIGGAPMDLEQGAAGKIPLAVVGVVPVKASAENGPIRPGDLLVASNTPGHAMKAGATPPVGTVIGKALQGLDKGTGIITMLVTLQ
jgi:hypothetical protein